MAAVRFEWDPRKAAANLRRHRVAFTEAIDVFANPLARTFDADLVGDEPREIIVGHSMVSRLLVVCFVQRQDAIRIISARKATTNERKDYEEGTA